METDKEPESVTTESTKTGRRHYVAPAVTDFFQPVVALGSQVSDGCATPKPPKH